MKNIPTAFSPLGGPLCPHKKKKSDPQVKTLLIIMYFELALF